MKCNVRKSSMRLCGCVGGVLFLNIIQL